MSPREYLDVLARYRLQGDVFFIKVKKIVGLPRNGYYSVEINSRHKSIRTKSKYKGHWNETFMLVGSESEAINFNIYEGSYLSSTVVASGPLPNNTHGKYKVVSSNNEKFQLKVKVTCLKKFNSEVVDSRSPTPTLTSASEMFITNPTMRSSPGFPPGYEFKLDPRGRIYYINHHTKTTSWEPFPEIKHLVSNLRLSSDSPIATPSLSQSNETLFKVHQPNNNRTVEPSNSVTSRPLPPGWEERRTPSGRLYYIDHNSKRTTWTRPGGTVAPQTNREELLPSSEESLPSGWELRHTPHGHPYYVNHNTRTTQWVHPNSSTLRRALPPGWTQSVTPDGRVFFIDHNRRITSYQDPRLSYLPESCPEIPKYERDFQQKVTALRSKLSPLPGEIVLFFNRNAVFQSSFEVLTKFDSSYYKFSLLIKFLGEEGLDYGGVSREWFHLLSLEFTNPNYALFKYSNDSHTNIVINPQSGINPEHIHYFTFVGKVIGLALFHNKIISCSFTLPFYKIILGKPLTVADLEHIDPVHYKSLRWILDNDIDDLEMGLYFTIDYKVFGELKTHELIPNGSSVEVTDENKHLYAELIVQWRIYDSVKLQTEAFLKGFHDFVPHEYISMFDEKELELLICGIVEISVDDWKKNSVYKNFNEDSPQVKWFWEFVREMDTQHRARLLQFITGTSRVPVGGFRGLQGSSGPQLFCLEKIPGDTDLPQSHTCFNRLSIPEYKSYEELKRKLFFAIEETEGFGEE